MSAVATSTEAIMSASARWQAGDTVTLIADDLGLNDRQFMVLRARLREFFPCRKSLMARKAAQHERWTPERIDAAISLWGEGKTGAEIGRLLGFSKNCVLNFIRVRSDQFPPRIKVVPVEEPETAPVRNTERSFVFETVEGALVSLPIVRGWSEGLRA